MKALSVGTYAALRRKIGENLLLGQRKIEEAKVRTYWETGRLIKEHILAHKDRADYGARVIERLAGDLDIDGSVLKRIRKFYELFPKGAPRHPLIWAHYRVLVAVPDEKKRLALADQAAKEAWNSHDLQRAVRDLNWNTRVTASDGAPSLLTVPALGPFFTYKIIKPETIHSKSNELLIDLGFSTVLELNRVSDSSYKPDTIVTSAKDPKGVYSLSRVPSPESQLYTYQAFVERVIDGDTLKVEIDLGFNIRIRQTIRLRAIDCPEMSTKEGAAAKKFVENALQGLEFITIKTVKSDNPGRDVKISPGSTGATGHECKYDRYLADLFVTDKAGRQIYLNNRLLEAGHAVRVRN